jgi:prepilin-type N-terminal cleavage/methylation domain-containing protein
MPSRLRRSSFATACSPSRPDPGRRGARRASGGFTLLEVVIALAVLGIGLGVIFQGLSQGLRLRGAAAENVRLALVAERVLGGLPERESAPEEPEEGVEDGCRWRLEAVAGTRAGRASVAGGDGEAAPVEVRLTVTGPSGRSWEMSTLLPPASGQRP